MNIFDIYSYNYFNHTKIWFKELHIDEDSATTLNPIKSERSEHQDLKLLSNMSKKEHMGLEHLMIAVTVAKESMESHNSGPILIRNYQRDKKLFLGHTVEFYVLDAWNQESSEPSWSNKFDQLRESRKQLGNDDSLII